MILTSNQSKGQLKEISPYTPHLRCSIYGCSCSQKQQSLECSPEKRNEYPFAISCVRGKCSFWIVNATNEQFRIVYVIGFRLNQLKFNIL